MYRSICSVRALCLFAVVSALTLAAPCAQADEAPITDPIPKKIAPSKIAVKFERVAEGLTMPLWLTHAGDGSGRLFVIDQVGDVRVIKNGKLLEKPYLDVREYMVQLKPNFDERGLLGIAFHPEFAKKNLMGYKRVYTYTSEPYNANATNDGPIRMNKRPDHQSVIAEWMPTDPSADFINSRKRREILRFDQPQFNHDGGGIVFGSDRKLYIATGDGGGAHDKAAGHGPNGNAQDLKSILGKVLRIDTIHHEGKTVLGRFSIPPNNPFVAAKGGGGAANFVWAYGLRNPFRMSMDRKTGDLIVGDVGQGAIEEINIIKRGGNYGWRIMEGTFYFSAAAGEEGRIRRNPPAGKLPKMIPPAAQYDHDEGISVIGGFVYRGKKLPQLDGLYVFGEWTVGKKQSAGRVMTANLKTGHIEELFTMSRKRVGGFVTGMGEDEEGEIYVLTSEKRGPTGLSGKVYRIVPN